MGRRRYTAAFKRRVVVEAMRGDQTVRAIAARHGINPNQLSRWKTEAYDGLPLSRKCELAGVSRASLYYEPKPVDARTLALRLVVDKLYMEFPYYGTRRVMLHLRRDGHAVGRDKARSLMAAVGWRTIHPGPRTTKPQPGHRIYPYLLADLADIRPGEVVCADITYIPVRGGFFYLVAVMDWASRFVLSWELDNTMEVGFCVSAMEEALRRAVDLEHGPGQPVHQRGVRAAAAGRGGADQHGRQGPVDGQPVRGAPVAVAEVRGRLSGGDRRRPPREAADRIVVRSLQSPTPHLAFGGRTPAEVYFGGRADVLLAAGG